MIEIHTTDVMVPDISPELFVLGVERLLLKEGKELGVINVICVSDEYLLDMNIKHLNHDYFTDIITFDYTYDLIVSGDLYVSVDRVADNAMLNAVSVNNEFLRVCVHGVLHLCGYKDKSDAEIVVMREKEDFYLSYCGFT
jgi:probable rRNA maturation factor